MARRRRKLKPYSDLQYLSRFILPTLLGSLVVIGSVFSLTWSAWSMYHYKTTAVRTTGEVTTFHRYRAVKAGWGRTARTRYEFVGDTSDRSPDSTQPNGDHFAAVVAFETEDGELIGFEDHNKSSRSPHQIGDSVPVLYSPTNPENSSIDKMSSFTRVPVVSVAILLASSFFTLMCLRNWRLARQLIVDGRLRKCVVQAVENTGDKDNPNWRIVAEVDTRTGNTIELISQTLKEKPDHLSPGDPVDVLVDRNDVSNNFFFLRTN